MTAVDPPGFSAKPVIAKWELWAVAKMLISTHGGDAQIHAQARLDEALAAKDEAAEITWSGVLTQLERIRTEKRQGPG